ncbi:MAG: four helix bundle protein [Candidatus Peribacteria bacterium]|nr:four helix bundle protein [Candidatus Peribacteria bacterium]
MYDQLTVFKTSYDLAIKLFQTMQNFPKEYKYLWGTDITQMTMEMLKYIYQANRDWSGRAESIQKSRDALEMLKLRWRIYRELEVISDKKYLELVPLFEDVSKQLTGRSKC